MKMKRFGHWGVVAGFMAAILLFTACSSPPEQPDSNGQDSGTPVVNDSSSADPAQGSDETGSDPETGGDPVALAQQNWQNGAHSTTFVVDSEGNNNSCARCHAPKEWMASLDDIPESCSACKFELEPPPPFIEESAWQHVSCVMCHQVDKKGNVEPEVSWLEIPPLDDYVSVETHSELCLKCHDTEGIGEHSQVIVGSGHEDMECTECHSPHSTTATCLTGDCHADVLSDTDQIPGHDEDHKDVSCAACHDSAGWDVGPHPETGVWVTFGPWTQEAKVGGEVTIINTGTVPFSSHDLDLEVNCDRCHFSGNTWGLTESEEIP